MSKEIVVLFYIQSSVADDSRRIIIKNCEYPFMPLIGGDLDMPAMDGMFAPEAKIKKVVYPATSYFESVRLRCYAELPSSAFNAYYTWLAQRKKEMGLTQEWAGWSIT